MDSGDVHGPLSSGQVSHAVTATSETSKSNNHFLTFMLLFSTLRVGRMDFAAEVASQRQVEAEIGICSWQRSFWLFMRWTEQDAQCPLWRPRKLPQCLSHHAS